MFVTAGTPEAVSALTEVGDAVGGLGISVHTEGDVLVVDGQRVVPLVIERAHPTPADLRELVAGAPNRLPALVVADRISDAGRDVLRAAGWGWLDRRGHLRLWMPGVRIESNLPHVGSERPNTGNVWTTVGLEIALAAMCQPDEPVTARRVAARIGRSVGATHELIGRFVERGLIGSRTHLPLMPDLFWETAGRWPDDGWIALPVGLDGLAARLGADELVRVDERAATLGGAHIAAAGDLPARCYVPTSAALRRARSLADRDQPTRTWVRRSPVRWLPELGGLPPDDDHPWRVAHPLVCALRLAADPARGREIVESWGIVPGTP
jgi:hypothetical protein